MTEPGPPEARPDPIDPIEPNGRTPSGSEPEPSSRDLIPAPGFALDDASDGDLQTDLVPDVAAPPPARPGLRTFSLEHRVAPGLYLVGWLACLLGVGFLVVFLLAPSGSARVILLIGALALLSVGLLAGAGQQALERRAGPPVGFTGPSPFLVFAAILPLSLLLALGGGFVLAVLGLAFDSAAGIVVGSLATALPFIVLVRLLVVGTGALSWSDIGFARRGRELGADVVSGVAWGIALVFATGFLAIALSSLLPIPPGPLPQATTFAERVAVLLVGVVIAPLSEEIFFRGYATTAWARSMTAGSAIVRSAIFFAFIHVLTLSGADTFAQGLGFAIFAFVGRIPISIGLAAIFLRRRSIYASLAMHATFNALPLLILFSS